MNITHEPTVVRYLIERGTQEEIQNYLDTHPECQDRWIQETILSSLKRKLVEERELSRQINLLIE